jgi:anti-sigma-K factor RskA
MEQELDILIEDYLDGRMDGAARQRFERRMETDPTIREKVYSATRSLELIQEALGWATPGEEFDSKVTSRIQEITSGALQPITPSSERALTRDDPEARLLGDPAADREKRRLLWIAIATSIIFAAAICAIVYFITHGK